MEKMEKDKGDKMKKFDKWLNSLGLKITAMVSTMYCAIIFAAIALISLPSVIQSHSLLVSVAWLAQTFLQLVLLSIIMVGQNVQSEKSEARMEKMLRHITKEVDRILKDIE